MRPHVRFDLPDGTVAVLAPGDLIGRNPRAALPVDDASISEAHAMVSLREGRLRLLALRGGLAASPTSPPARDLPLEAGGEVWLSRGFRLGVADVVLPGSVLALVADGLGRRMLSGVTSVLGGDPPEVVGRFSGRAAAVLWNVGDAWQLRVGDAAPRAVAAGDAFTVHGRTYTLAEVDLAGAGHQATVLDGGVRPTLRVVARFDTVHVHRPGEPVVVLTHTAARIVSELVAFDGPVHWETLAREVWPDDAEPYKLRGRWDVSLARLRKRLAKAQIRSDFLQSDGAGNVELVLYPGDTLEDAT